MSSSKQRLRNISVRLAADESEVKKAQNLRYKIFYEEYNAQPSAQMKAEERDFDEYDAYSDHLIVTDRDETGTEKIVGTYRLLRNDQAEKCGDFYSSQEYDLSCLKKLDLNLLELGRSCVLPDYRAGSVLTLLWQGIANYIMEHEIDIMFGCASIHTTDLDLLARPLSYMHHFHLAPRPLRTRALPGRYIDMDMMPKEDINPKAVFADLPPLIKGYLRVGCLIGSGAVIDPVFNTTDVCVIAQTHLVTERYRKHYERKTQKTLPSKPKSSLLAEADTVSAEVTDQERG